MNPIKTYNTLRVKKQESGNSRKRDKKEQENSKVSIWSPWQFILKLKDYTRFIRKFNPRMYKKGVDANPLTRRGQTTPQMFHET